MAYAVGWEDIEEGIDTGLSSNAKIRDAFTNTQTALNSLDSRVTVSEGFQDNFLEAIFSGSSTAADQQPTGTNTELQIEFGIAQNDGADKAMIDVNGTITFNVAGTYTVKFKTQYGRSGAAAASLLAFRWLVNDVMSGNALVAKVDDDVLLLPWEAELLVVATAGDTLKAEIIRDSGGHDSGGLFKTTLNASGWGDAPSASIAVKKLF